MKYSSQENKIQFPDLIGKASDVQIIKAPDGTERILIDGVEIPNVSTYSMNIEFHKMPTFSANVIVRSFEIISPELSLIHILHHPAALWRGVSDVLDLVNALL